MHPPLTPLDDALAALLCQAHTVAEMDTLSILDGDGRVLAQDIHSPLHVPSHDNSAMDGYALHCADVPVSGTVLSVSQRIAAGCIGEALQPHTTARIFTGAPVPPGADAIVKQEDCEVLADGRVRIHATPRPGQCIRRAGEDIAHNAVVLRQGVRLTPAELGLAASMGLHQLPVARRLRVAMFSTGDELVMPGDVPPDRMRPGAIYNSNRFFLRALLSRLGCEVTDMGTVPDQYGATVAALQRASSGHDIIVTSGGVSVGEEDHVKPAVQSLGHLELWQIAMKPGKPFAYGRVGQAHFIGLPGNPVSGFVTFVLLVRPFVLRLQGVQDVALATHAAIAHFDWPRADQRREFLRARYNAQGGLDLFANQGSGVLTSMAWADGLVDNPPGRTIQAGDAVRFIPFSALLA